MNITPFIFLVIYLAGIAIIFLLGILNMYHILRFGFSKTNGLVVTFVFILMMVGVVLASFQMLKQIKWQEPLDINIPFINVNDNTNNGS